MNNINENLLQEIRNPNKIWHHLPDPKSNTSLKISPPISIEIQPTATCNLRCKWCSYWHRNEFESKTINYLHEDIITDISTYISKNNVKSIYLGGGGEPCAYPHIRNTVKKLHEAGASLAIITNGTLFAAKLLDLAHYFNYIQVSLISSNQENYFESTTSKKGYELMKKLPYKIKDFHKEKAPLVGGMFVITKWNYKHTFEIAEFCRFNKYDYCSFRRAIDFENRGIALSEEIQKHLLNEIENNKHLFSKYTNLQQVIEYANRSSYTPKKCINIHQGLYAIVGTKGDVFICVPDIGFDEYKIGNLYQNSFEEIWNGELHKRMIKKLSDRYSKKLCHIDCRAHLYNEVYARGTPIDIPDLHSEFI